MDWLKSILDRLPLDKISDILGEIVIWWSQLVKDVPPADLPMYAYFGGSVLVLLLWILVARMLPRPLGGMSWMLLFAVLLAPGTALNDVSVIAPASISVVYAIMMKDVAAAITNALPILVVLVVGLFIGFLWQLIRGAFDSSLDKARRRTAEDTQATMQLTTGNYLLGSADERLPVASSGHLLDSDISSDSSVSLKKVSPVDKKPVKEGFYSKKPTKPSVAERVIAKAKGSQNPVNKDTVNPDLLNKDNIDKKSIIEQSTNANDDINDKKE